MRGITTCSWEGAEVRTHFITELFVWMPSDCAEKRTRKVRRLNNLSIIRDFSLASLKPHWGSCQRLMWILALATLGSSGNELLLLVVGSVGSKEVIFGKGYLCVATMEKDVKSNDTSLWRVLRNLSLCGVNLINKMSVRKPWLELEFQRKMNRIRCGNASRIKDRPLGGRPKRKQEKNIAYNV